MAKFYPFALASSLLAALATPVSAQDTPPETATRTATQGVLVFTPDYFASSRPNTALDMVNRLPGFSLDSGDNVRGFAGAAGNVLIDGKRPTTKSDSLSDTLARIPVDQVERVELIRGGTAGIDMQGQPVIANVIRKNVDGFQQTLTAYSFLFTETGKALPGGNYQATRRAGEHQFDFQLSAGVSMDDSIGDAVRTTVDVQAGQTTQQDVVNDAGGFAYTAKANYKGPLAGGELSLNGLVSTDIFKDDSVFSSPTTMERYAGRSANDRGELSINYTHDLGEKLEIEALALSKIATGEGRSTGDDGTTTSLFEVEAEAGESIARSVLRYEPVTNLSFEGGGEVAFNFREQTNALTIDGTPIVLPASDVRVEELRGEGFVQGTWRPDPKYTLESGVRFEQSTITQSGDIDRERSFTYTKPRALFTWSPTEDNQLRLRIEREVGQLNFQDFVSSVNLDSNVVSSGNAELEPDKTWAYEVAFEKRFWENGAAILTLRHEEITDVVDEFPFFVFDDANSDGIPDDANNDGQPDQTRVSGPGNIGNGTNDVIELDLTLPLDKIGITGGELKIETLFQNGEVTDPLTGQTRNISSQRPNDVSVSFRHDLPEYKLTYGLFWFAGWSEDRFRLQEIRSLDLRNYWETFVEYKPTTRFTLRAELKNFNPYSFTIQRRIFDGPRDTGSLAFIETESRNSQVIAMIRGRLTLG